MSNQADNEIGVWHSDNDGSLVWNGRYSTGGVGYPDPLDANNFNDLSSSNALIIMFGETGSSSSLRTPVGPTIRRACHYLRLMLTPWI